MEGLALWKGQGKELFSRKERLWQVLTLLDFYACIIKAQSDFFFLPKVIVFILVKDVNQE